MESSLALNNHYSTYITNKLSEHANPNKDTPQFVQSDEFTHKEKKQKFLQAELQTNDVTFDSTSNMHTLSLSKIPQNLTASDLKRSLKLQYLIEIDVDTDNVKNISTGKGRISLRSNAEGKQGIIDKLGLMGITAEEYKRKSQKRERRVGTSGIGILDSRNEIDLMKGNRDYKIDTAKPNTDQRKNKSKTVKKVTGKVGENLFIKPKDYLHDFKNETKEKRVVFYESNADLFGNTNGSYAKTHGERLTKNKSNFELNQKENRAQHKLIDDWTKMQKRINLYATNRATKPKITRYGRTYDF